MPSDDFVGTNNDPLNPTNWAETLGDWVIFSNQAFPNAGGKNIASWTTGAAANNQWAECVVGTVVGNHIGLSLRGASGRGYVFGMGSVGYEIARVDDSATQITLDSGGTTVTSGDTLRFEVTGSVFKAFKNSVQVGVDCTDATYASGQYGLWGNGAGGQSAESWTAGDLGGGAGANDLSANLAEPVIGRSVF